MLRGTHHGAGPGIGVTLWQSCKSQRFRISAPGPETLNTKKTTLNLKIVERNIDN